jgi:hypothetical protein
MPEDIVLLPLAVLTGKIPLPSFIENILAPPLAASFTKKKYYYVLLYECQKKYGYSTDRRIFDSEIILLPSSVPTSEKKILHHLPPLFAGEKCY